MNIDLLTECVRLQLTTTNRELLTAFLNQNRAQLSPIERFLLT